MKHLTVFFDDALVGLLAEGEGGDLYFYKKFLSFNLSSSLLMVIFCRHTLKNVVCTLTLINQQKVFVVLHER